MIAAWQSDAQLKQRWGDNGAAIINDNLTVEVILPGVRDTDTLARVSKLVGEVSVVKSTHTVNGTGAAASVGAQTVEKVVLRADEIRRLGEHHPDQALLVHRTMSAVMVRLPRWFDGPDAIARCAMTRPHWPTRDAPTPGPAMPDINNDSLWICCRASSKDSMPILKNSTTTSTTPWRALRRWRQGRAARTTNTSHGLSPRQTPNGPNWPHGWTG